MSEVKKLEDVEWPKDYEGHDIPTGPHHPGWIDECRIATPNHPVFNVVPATAYSDALTALAKAEGERDELKARIEARIAGFSELPQTETNYATVAQMLRSLLTEGEGE